MPLHIPTLGERVTEADIWAYPTRVITGAIEVSATGTVAWLKASGTTETLLLEVAASVREIVIDISEMGSVEPGTQVLTFRVYRYMNGGWVFDDSVDVVPDEKDVLTVSDVHGQMKIMMEPSAETQQDYSLPYTLYYQ